MNNINNNNTNNAYMKEFQYRTKNDGIILIKKDKIIKKNPTEKLTVDLIYDRNIHVFLDSDKNVYKCCKTKNEIYKL